MTNSVNTDGFQFGGKLGQLLLKNLLMLFFLFSYYCLFFFFFVLFCRFLYELSLFIEIKKLKLESVMASNQVAYFTLSLTFGKLLDFYH